MPGVTAIWSRTPEPDGAPSPGPDASSPDDFRDYCATTMIREPGVRVASYAYDAYPVRRLDCPETVFVVEGRLFPQAKSLRELCEELDDDFPSQKQTTSTVRELLQGADGDFVLIAYRPEEGRLVLVTDALGRLPIYKIVSQDFTVVSRNFVRGLLLSGGLRLDRRGVAEFLTFGYCLGSRTLFESVERLPPATVLQFTRDDGSAVEDQYHVFSFASDQKNRRDIQANAEELAHRFREAAIRQGDSRPVISLSGGLDSRSVAAALADGPESVYAVTYLDDAGVAAGDVEVAAQIAEVLGIEWSLFRLGAPTNSDRRTLVTVKAGLNSVIMAFILPFHRRVRSEFGSGIHHLTGDGGDKVLPKLSPARRLRDLDDLVGLIFDKHAVMSPETAEQIVGLSAGVVAESLRQRIAGYPEDEWAGKLVHFLIYERAMRQNFEGEDRNRHYFWSSTPFYSMSVFEYAFECPEAQKAGYRLYARFLSELSREVAEIERPAFGGAITDWRHRLLRRAQEGIARFPKVESAIDRVRRGSPSAISEGDGSVLFLRGFGNSSAWPDRALNFQVIDREIEGGRLTRRQACLLESVGRAAAHISEER